MIKICLKIRIVQWLLVDDIYIELNKMCDMVDGSHENAHLWPYISQPGIIMDQYGWKSETRSDWWIPLHRIWKNNYESTWNTYKIFFMVLREYFFSDLLLLFQAFSPNDFSVIYKKKVHKLSSAFTDYVFLPI
jgi:hypothetical protein